MNKIIYDVGKLQRAHPTSRGHFAYAYLVGSNMLRAYLFFIYGLKAFCPIHFVNYYSEISLEWRHAFDQNIYVYRHEHNILRQSFRL